MDERLPFRQDKKEDAPPVITFPLTLPTIAIMRNVLVISNAREEYAAKILRKLPIPLKVTQDFSVSLGEEEVDFVSGLIGVDEIRDAHLNTKFRQAFWELNMAFVNAGGEIQENFKGMLKRNNL